MPLLLLMALAVEVMVMVVVAVVVVAGCTHRGRGGVDGGGGVDQLAVLRGPARRVWVCWIHLSAKAWAARMFAENSRQHHAE